MKKGSELSHGIVKKKIPNLLKNCVCAVVVTAVYIIIFKGDLSVTDLEHIFAGGGRLLNWYFLECIVLYLCCALAVKISRNNREYCLTLLGMVMGLIMIFYIEVQKGLLGAWWVASIPIFCVGVLIALKDSQISINHFNVVVICLTIVLVLLHIDIWYFDIFKIAFPFKGILSIWTEGAIFSMLLYLVSSKLKSEHSKFSWMGKNSAEMLFAQSISLSILRSSHLYIENNVLYLLGSIVMQILVVLIYERLFKCKFWRFDNA